MLICNYLELLTYVYVPQKGDNEDREIPHILVCSCTLRARGLYIHLYRYIWYYYVDDHGDVHLCVLCVLLWRCECEIYEPLQKLKSLTLEYKIQYGDDHN